MFEISKNKNKGRRRGGKDGRKQKRQKKIKNERREKLEMRINNIFKLQGNKTNLGNTYRIIEIYESFVSYLLLYIKLLLKLSSLKQ